jgi:hypothetical protein
MRRSLILLAVLLATQACRETSRPDVSTTDTRAPIATTGEPAAPATPPAESGIEDAVRGFASREKTSDGAEGAVAVIDAYYAAINRRDYPTAHRYWSSNGEASGQTLAEFTSGFADTASVAVDVGTPGRIDPAAGSRYIEIPVTVTARTRAGATQRFRGHYVLRRSVVDGATAEQRQWRIASAALKAQ